MSMLGKPLFLGRGEVIRSTSTAFPRLGPSIVQDARGRGSDHRRPRGLPLWEDGDRRCPLCIEPALPWSRRSPSNYVCMYPRGGAGRGQRGGCPPRRRPPPGCLLEPTARHEVWS